MPPRNPSYLKNRKMPDKPDKKGAEGQEPPKDYVELKKIAAKHQAVRKIKQFMAQHNKSYEDKSEIEAMQGVGLLLGQLKKQKTENSEMQTSINLVLKMLQDGWVPFGRDLYFFDERTLIFTQANDACGRHNAWLISIRNTAEEEFVEKEVNKRLRDNDPGYWIGLMKAEDKWQWVNRDGAMARFWASTYPAITTGGVVICAYIPRCEERRKCWKDEVCSDRRKFICQWKADNRWF
ncbi:lithostathine-1-beta-like isoform X2 [Paroedura picta]|uniref:lithostathine-1-beta-like isoform X2 n=1 Tax=Paroedura picta TaxID=143630 RepID=UPI0040564B9A